MARESWPVRVPVNVTIRDFDPDDVESVNAVALAAFSQYQDIYKDWETFSQNISRMASLAEQGELIVATREDKVVGAVVYIGPHKPRSDIFEPAWPIIRMLVVSPDARGLGIGRALAQECISRARRDGALDIALHTSPIMEVALQMYQRMGFVHMYQAPDTHGVPYGVYLMRLKAAPAVYQALF